jgi:division protein CdvB (Snf7/Vps24/ESCRT-III family)
LSKRWPFRLLGVGRDENVKPKIASTIKEIELHRRELENLRVRVEQRRKSLYDTTLKAMTAKDRSKAVVYANEWAELRKVGKVVYASELALTQVILRLESIVDVGDVMSHLSMAFKVLRKVNKTVQGLVPSLDQASSEITNTLTETMAEMSNVSPNFSLSVNTESGEELVEQARKFAEQRAEEMKQSLGVTSREIREAAEPLRQTVALLEGGEEGEEDEDALGVLYTDQKPEGLEERVLQYAVIHNGNVDITDASTALKLPPDDVEEAMLNLLNEGKMKVSQQDGGTG